MLKMKKEEREINIPALRELIAREVDWIGVHECLTEAYKNEAHKILTAAGYVKSKEVFMETHIDPNMAHYRYYHPRLMD